MHINSLAKPSPSVVCKNGTRISKKLIGSRFNLDSIKKVQKTFYLLQGNNIPLAIDDIMFMNSYLAEAHHLLKYFPSKRIFEFGLRFEETVINGRNSFCFIYFNPKTKTGKLPKFPVTLVFYNSDDLFGEIYYNQNGEIEKALIVAWDGTICYEINIKIIKGELKINTITRTNPITYKKEKMYYQ